MAYWDRYRGSPWPGKAGHRADAERGRSASGDSDGDNEHVRRGYWRPERSHRLSRALSWESCADKVERRSLIY